MSKLDSLVDNFYGSTPAPAAQPSDETAAPASAPAELGAGDGANDNVRRFLDFLGKAEGADYDVIVGGGRFNDFSRHPNVVGLRTAEGPSTAAGKYQITGTTYRDFAPQLGINDFSPESQDRLALAIIEREGALNDVRAGNFDAAIQKLGNRWASLPSSPYSQPKRDQAFVDSALGAQQAPARRRLEEAADTFLSTNQGALEQAALDQQAMVDRGRGMGEIVADTGLAVAGGFGGLGELVGTGIGLVTGDMDNALRSGGADLREWAQNNQSKVMQAQKSLRQLAIEGNEDEAGKFFAYLSETLGSPSLAIDFMAEQAPQLLVMGGAGRIAGGVAKAAGAGQAATGTAGTATAIGAGSSMQGLDAAGQAYDQIKALPRALQLQNPTVQKLIAGGASEDEAIERAARAEATTAGFASGVTSAALNMLPWASTLERALAGAGTRAGGRLAGAAKGFIGEGLSESLDETGGVVAANYATQQLDPSQALSEGVGEAAAAGAMFAPFGGVAGAMERPAAPIPNSPLTNAANLAAGSVPPGAPGAPAGQGAAPADPAARLAELEAITAGTPAQTVMGPSGQPMTIPGEQPRFFTQQEQDEYRALKAQMGSTPTDADQQGAAPDPLAQRVAQVSTIVEDKALIGSLRSDPRFGKESVTDLLAAYAKARNPNLDPLIRTQALDSIDAFMRTFENRPNFTMGGAQAEQGAEQPAGTPEPFGSATPQLEAPAFAERDITPRAPTPELETEQLIRARRTADAEYDQAFQDLVKAEQLGASDAELMEYQLALDQAKLLRADLDAELEAVQRRIEEGRKQKSAESRRAILDAILADPQTANPAARFTAELQRQGYRDIVPDADEMATIQRFENARAAVSSMPEDVQPAQAATPAQSAQPVKTDGNARQDGNARPRLTVDQVKQAVADGASLDGNVLRAPGAEPIALQGPMLAAAREAVRRREAGPALSPVAQGVRDAVESGDIARANPEQRIRNQIRAIADRWETEVGDAGMARVVRANASGALAPTQETLDFQQRKLDEALARKNGTAAPARDDHTLEAYLVENEREAKDLRDVIAQSGLQEIYALADRAIRDAAGYLNDRGFSLRAQYAMPLDMRDIAKEVSGLAGTMSRLTKKAVAVLREYKRANPKQMQAAVEDARGDINRLRAMIGQAPAEPYQEQGGVTNDVPTAEQVAPQAQEAGGQEGAAAGDSTGAVISADEVAKTAQRIATRQDPRSADPRVDRIEAQEAYLQEVAGTDPEAARRIAAELRADPQRFSDISGTSPDKIGVYARIIEDQLRRDDDRREKARQSTRPDTSSAPEQDGPVGLGDTFQWNARTYQLTKMPEGEEGRGGAIEVTVWRDGSITPVNDTEYGFTRAQFERATGRQMKAGADATTTTEEDTDAGTGQEDGQEWDPAALRASEGEGVGRPAGPWSLEDLNEDPALYRAASEYLDARASDGTILVKAIDATLADRDAALGLALPGMDRPALPADLVVAFIEDAPIKGDLKPSDFDPKYTLRYAGHTLDIEVVELEPGDVVLGIPPLVLHEGYDRRDGEEFAPLSAYRVPGIDGLFDFVDAVEQGYAVLAQRAGQSPAGAEMDADIADQFADAADPTDGQKEAGNYQMAHVRIDGMDVSIETEKGAQRSGTDANGTAWTVTMPSAYGYIKGTKGADKDHVDIFVGPNPDNGTYYVINQMTPIATGKDLGKPQRFDEHKVAVGFASENEAVANYLLSFADDFGARVFGSISGPYTADEFKALIPALEKAAPIEKRAKKDKPLTLATPEQEVERFQLVNWLAHVKALAQPKRADEQRARDRRIAEAEKRLSKLPPSQYSDKAMGEWPNDNFESFKARAEINRELIDDEIRNQSSPEAVFEIIQRTLPPGGFDALPFSREYVLHAFEKKAEAGTVRTRRIRVDDAPAVEVTLPSGNVYRMNRLTAGESMGLAGWHDMDRDQFSFLGDNQEQAIAALIEREAAAAQKSAEANAAPADYEARYRARRARIEAATTTEELDAIVAEEHNDDERHFEGTNLVEREARDAKSRLKRAEERRIKDEQDERALADGQWVEVFTTSLGSEANAQLKKLSSEDPAHEYKLREVNDRNDVNYFSLQKRRKTDIPADTAPAEAAQRQAEASDIPEPKNWRTSYGAAQKYAEALGVDPRGENGKFMKLPELVAAIDAKRGAGSADVALTDEGKTEAAPEAESESLPRSAESALAQRLRKIADIIESQGTRNGTRPLDKRWAEGAIQRLMDGERVLAGMLGGKQYGALASAKIALSKKPLTIDDLRKIADKLDAADQRDAADESNVAFIKALEEARKELPGGFDIQPERDSVSLMENGRYAVNGLSRTVAGIQEAVRLAKQRATDAKDGETLLGLNRQGDEIWSRNGDAERRIRRDGKDVIPTSWATRPDEGWQRGFVVDDYVTERGETRAKQAEMRAWAEREAFNDLASDSMLAAVANNKDNQDDHFKLAAEQRLRAVIGKRMGAAAEAEDFSVVRAFDLVMFKDRPMLGEDFYVGLRKHLIQVAEEAKQAALKAQARDPLAVAMQEAGYAPESEDGTKFIQGWEHALDGKTKSTLPNGEAFAAGYAKAQGWMTTPEGKAAASGRRAKKLKNTGADLRRWFDDAKKKAREAQTDVDKLLEQLEAATNRAELLRGVLAEDATPGAVRWFGMVRNIVPTFKDWLGDKSPVSRMDGAWTKDPMKKLRYFIAGEADSRIDSSLNGDESERMEHARNFAETYIENVRALAEGLLGVRTVEEGAKRLAEMLAKNTGKLEGNWYDLTTSSNQTELGAQMQKFGFVDTASPARRKLAQLIWQFGATRGDNPDTRKWDSGREGGYPGAYVYQLMIDENKSLESSRKQALTPPRMDRVNRDGEDYRNGQDVTPEQFKETFNFADVGFGQWVGARQDQDHLNYAHDAFRDLAALLNLPPKAIALAGKLHFTIGALGHGKFAAHYQVAHPHPDGGTVPVINVTNTKGDGTVAHEWAHALDLTNQGEGQTPLNRVIDQIKQELRYGYDMKRIIASVDGFLLGGSYWKGDKRSMGTDEGRIYGAAKAIDYYAAPSRNKSAYFKEAQALDGSKKSDPYWSNDKEIFARAFEAWVADRLEFNSNYLVNPEWAGEGAITGETHRGTPYPMGDERKRFNEYFDALAKSLKEVDGRIELDLVAWEQNRPKYRQEWDAALKDLEQSLRERLNALKAQQSAEAEYSRIAVEESKTLQVGDIVVGRPGFKTGETRYPDRARVLSVKDANYNGWMSIEVEFIEGSRAGQKAGEWGHQFEVVERANGETVAESPAAPAPTEPPAPPPAPERSPEPAGELTEADYERLFDEAAAELQEANQEKPEVPPPGAEIQRPRRFSADDVREVIRLIESGEMVLLATRELGVPTIHDFSGSADHIGMGVIRARTPEFEATWTAGGAMYALPSGEAYTTVSVNRGTFPYDRDGILATLRAALPAEQSSAKPEKTVAERAIEAYEALLRGEKLPGAGGDFSIETYNRPKKDGGKTWAYVQGSGTHLPADGYIWTKEDAALRAVYELDLDPDVIEQTIGVFPNGYRAGQQAPSPRPPRKQPATNPAPTLTDDQQKSVARMAADAAKLGVKGIDNALSGLVRLFGGGPGKLMSFPGGFNEETYQQAKPYFEEALQNFQAAGKTIKDLFAFLIQQLGLGVKPYAVQFAKDKKLSASLGEKPSAAMQVADFVAGKLDRGEKFTSRELFEAADKAFGGTQAEGTYSPKDAYDGMEAGVNRWLMSKPGIKGAGSAEAAAAMVQRFKTEILEKLPTQTRRDAEMDEFQQFSTPPSLAYVASWVANVNAEDTMMEPSAGTGDLAVYAKNAGASLVLNELSSRRAEVLRGLFPQARIFTENAEQLNNILPADVRPSVVIMNPPFSATAGRIEGQRKSKNGAAHIEQALKRLAPNGRLVAIMGEGMGYDRPAFRAWYSEIQKTYNVRAVIGIDGREYAKYGTTFDNVILVIDKDGPQRGEVLTGKVDSVEALPAMLENIRESRPQLSAEDRGGQPPSDQQDGPGDPGEDGMGGKSDAPTPDDADDVRGGKRGGGRGGRSGGGTGGRGGSSRAGGNRRDGGSGADQGDGRSGGSGGNAGGGADGQSESDVTIEDSGGDRVEGELTDSIFENYSPQRLKIPGAKKHPGKLVQSAAMAAVEPPAPTYTPNLPKEVIEGGLLSDAQLEAIVYAGQAHAQMLPNGQRRGFFIGDGTGVGKGREIAGIILDNMRQGRKKAVWVSFNQGLINDAKRDFGGIGGNADLIFSQQKTKAANSIDADSGILFTTYSTLRGGQQAQGGGAQAGRSRLDQIVEWLGEDFDGAIMFDEAHSMGNAVEIKGKRGKKKPSAQALAGIELQARLPKARIVYVSATGATEVNNLAYASRLGLWGEGTPFPNVAQFISQIIGGGVAAMELVARDMKALGMYLARSLSYDGATYRRLDHELTDLQRDIYNELATAWQLVLNNVNAALEMTNQGSDGKAKSAAMSRFWGTHQRFFNQVITAMMTPSAIDDIQQQLDAGNAVVIQLINTNEAEQERQAAKAKDEDVALEELDFTPRQALMDYVRNAFPVAQFEERTDENGNAVYEMVLDSSGNPVLNQDAVAARDALLKNLEMIRVPGNPIDEIVQAFGADMVAEVTGRKRRFVREVDEDGNERLVEEKRGAASSQNDAKAFQDDKKKILIFSQAGGTGYSFHADNTAKNKRKRLHYILQPGWRADSAVQGFGRTHRTNQAQEPEYVLMTTDLKAQKRFVSSIARRLDQLGALTRGQRQAGTQGLFNASDNLESKYAEAALETLFTDLAQGRAEGLDFAELRQQMGLDSLVDSNGVLNTSKVPEVPQFLNRLLSLTSDMQDRVFDAFERRLVEAVEYAQQNGTYDSGMATLRAEKVEKVRDEVVHTEQRTSSKTQYVELAVTNPVRYNTFDEVKRRMAQSSGGGEKPHGWYRRKDTGEVFAFVNLGQRANGAGQIEYRAAIMRIKNGWQYRPNAQEIEQGFAYVRNARGYTERRELYERIEDEALARELFEQQVAVAPATETHDIHMITGVILPIWDRMKGHPQIVRTQTDDGERLLGRVVSKKDLKAVLKNLGVGSAAAKMAPADQLARILEGNVAILANGWQIRRSLVSGEPRIEVLTRATTPAQQRELVSQGAIQERIQWQERFFIPTGAQAQAVFERIVAAKPVVDLVDPNAKPDQDPDDQAGAALPSRPRPGGYASNSFRAEIDATPSEQVARDVQFLRQQIEEAAGRAGLSARSATIEPAKVPDAARGMVAIVKRVFGVDVRFVRAEGLPSDLAFDGIYVGRNVVYVNANSTKPFSAVIGHEFLHYLRHAAPDVYDGFVQQVARLLNLSRARLAANAEAESYLRNGTPEGEARSMGWEEIYADVFADSWADPQFWQALAQQNLNVAQKALQALRRFLGRVKAQLFGERSSPLRADLYRDFDQVREIVLGASARFAEGGYAPYQGLATTRFMLADRGDGGPDDGPGRGGRAPASRKSEGGRARITETEAFKKWFGGERVVNIAPNELEFRESEQNRTSEVAERFQGGDYNPIVVIVGDGDRAVILDGHNRASVAADRGHKIPAVAVTRREYDSLSDLGFDDIEIAYAALVRAGQEDAASDLDRQFSGAAVMRRGMEAWQELPDDPVHAFDPTNPSILASRNVADPVAGLTPAQFRAALVERFGEQGVATLEREGILNIGTSDTRGLAAWYEPNEGRAYFDPSRIGTATEAIAAVLHEIGEHHGLRDMLGERGWQTLRNRLAELATKGGNEVAAAWTGVIANYPEFERYAKDTAAAIQSDRFVHEVLAKLGESAAGRKSSVWRDLLAAINRFLLKMGVGRQINKAEIADLVEGSLKRQMRGKGAKRSLWMAGEPVMARRGERVTAAWTPERITGLLRQFAYGMDATRTKAYAAWVSPEDFLSATTPASDRDRLESERRPLDAQDLTNETQPIFLDVQATEDDEGAFRIVGHEGRHRMMALRDAGVRSVPVVLWLRDAKYDAQAIDEPFFMAQRFSDKTKGARGFYASHAYPISYANEQALREDFGNEAGVMFQRAFALSDYFDSGAAKRKVRDHVAGLFDSAKTFNWWQRTVGSQYGKARSDADFGRVYEKAHDFIDDVSKFARNASDKALGILPHMDTFGDVAKGLNARRAWSDAKDYQAIADAIFTGTLDDKVWNAGELRARFGLDDKQIALYRQFRAATDHSLETLAASEMARAARAEGMELADPRMSLDETEAFYVGKVQPLVDAAVEILEGLRLKHRIELEDAAGLPQRERDALIARQARERMQAESALAKVAALRDSFTAKKDEIRKLQGKGYAPLMRFGQYTVDVVRLDEDGKPAKDDDGEIDRPFFGMFESEAEAREAERIMREEYPGYTVSRGIASTQSSELYQGMSPEAAEMFARLLGVDVNDAFQTYLRQALNNRSAMKRLIQRKGMAGFANDVPRVLASFITSNARLASSNWHFGEMRRAAEAIPKHKGDVKDEAIRLMNYIQNPQEEAAAVRGFLFFSFLGGSIASAIVNTTQTFSTTLPYLNQFGPARAAKAIGGAMGLAARAMKDGLDVVRDRDLRGALQAAAEDGIIDPQEIHLLMAEARGSSTSNVLGMAAGLVNESWRTPAERVGRAAASAWGSFFGAAEKYNRHVAFIAAWEVAEGMAPADFARIGVKDRFEFARRAVIETQFDYSKAARPNWARGPIGATLFTFRTFMVNYLEFLVRLPSRERAVAVAVLLLFAGLSGVPGTDDLDDLVDTIAQKLGYNWNNKGSRHAWLVDVLGEGGANFIEHGISAFIPLDVSARLGMGNLAPSTGVFKESTTSKEREIAEFFGPAGSVFQGVIDTIGNVGSGKDSLEVLRPVLPKAINDFRQAWDIATTGEYRDYRGRKVVDADLGDAFIKAIGFHPNVVAEPKRVERMLQQSAALHRTRRAEINEAWARGIVENDPDKVARAREMLRDWNRKNPTTPIRMNPESIKSRVRAMRSTSAERLVKAASKDMRNMLENELAVTN